MMLRNLHHQIETSFNILNIVRYSSSRTAITRMHRSIYSHMPIMKLVLPDGSIQRIRYHEPRLAFRMPLDLNNCSEEERRKRLILRTPISKIKIEEEISTSFNVNEYSFLWKNKKKS